MPPIHVATPRRGDDHAYLIAGHNGAYPPYVGCLEYLDLAFDWAETHKIKILIDLHTVPDSQNGFDNGGPCGVCKYAPGMGRPAVPWRRTT